MAKIIINDDICSIEERYEITTEVKSQVDKDFKVIKDFYITDCYNLMDKDESEFIKYMRNIYKCTPEYLLKRLGIDHESFYCPKNKKGMTDFQKNAFIHVRTDKDAKGNMRTYTYKKNKIDVGPWSYLFDLIYEMVEKAIVEYNEKNNTNIKKADLEINLSKLW